jgi:hypothetical protein
LWSRCLGAELGREVFPLTTFAARPNIQSHTGFGGCDAVEPDSPMYITLPKNRET